MNIVTLKFTKSYLSNYSFSHNYHILTIITSYSTCSVVPPQTFWSSTSQSGRVGRSDYYTPAWLCSPCFQTQNQSRDSPCLSVTVRQGIVTNNTENTQEYCDKWKRLIYNIHMLVEKSYEFILKLFKVIEKIFTIHTLILLLHAAN